MNILSVDPNHIHQTWPLVSKYIESSIEKGMAAGSADYSADHVLAYLASGQWILLVATDENNEIQGAMTVSFINYPLNRVAFITTTGGKSIITKETFSQLEAIAKYHGATKIQAMARPSMARMLGSCGFESGNTMMEIKI